MTTTRRPTCSRILAPLVLGILQLLCLGIPSLAHEHHISHDGSEDLSHKILVVDVRDAHIHDDIPLMIAIQVCSGLFNHDPQIAGAGYTLWEESDKIWVTEILEQDATLERIPMQPEDYITTCLATVAKGRFIHYNYHRQRLVVPNLITLAAVLHAVPLVAELQTTLMTFPNQVRQAQHKPTISFQQVFDAETTFQGFTAYDATKYMFHHYAKRTTSMSIMNPGYDNTINDDDPNAKNIKTDNHGNPMVMNPKLNWVDYIVKEHLFNFYLPKGCFRFTMEHALMEEMVNPQNTDWPQPLAVFGYNDVKMGPAYLYESETFCAHHHNMGQVATETNNLAFWSRKPALEEPLKQPYPPSTLQHSNVYDPTKTYIGLIIGDGDNVAFVKNRNYEWVQNRLEKCANTSLPEAHRCFPISWSISPHLPHLAPELLQWYYQQAQVTQNDYFVLPPSGFTYSYPGIQSPEFQDEFVHKTEEAARILNTTGTVDWEFLLTWRHAIRTFFPRYAASTNDHKIRGLFPVNVPFNVPVFSFGRHEYYKLIHAPHGDGTVVLFRPREWRGTSGHSVRVFASKAQNLRPDQMAAELNGYPKGTVAYIYLTSDDHCDLDSLYQMVPDLNDHVQIVNHEMLIDMALQRG